MPIQPIQYQGVTQFQPVTHFVNALAASQKLVADKQALEESKMRNRLFQMQMKDAESDRAFKNEIANSLMTPKAVKDVSFGAKRLTDVPLAQPGGNLAPRPGVTPSGGINENAIAPAPVITEIPDTNLSGITPEMSQAIKGALPAYGTFAEESREIIPMVEQAKALGINLSPDIIAQNPVAALDFIEKKKAEQTAVMDKKINMIKDINAINPSMAANLWNNDPILSKNGKMDISQNGDTQEVKVNGEVIGYNVKTPDGKWHYDEVSDRSVSDFKTFYKGYKQENQGANDAEISRAWHKMKLDESQQRVQFGVSLRADTQMGDDFKDWNPKEQEQAILRGLITGKGSSEFFSRGDRKNYANFSHASQKYQVDNGFTPGMVARMQSDYKARDKSLGNQTKIYDMMNSFVMNINSQIDKTKEIYEKLPRTQYRLLNIPIKELRARAKGSGEEAAAASYLVEISNEIGKLSTGSAASIRELSESAQKQWKMIHDGTMPMKDLAIVLDTTQVQANMRLKATKDAMDMTRQLIEEISPIEQQKPSAGNGTWVNVNGVWKMQ